MVQVSNNNIITVNHGDTFSLAIPVIIEPSISPTKYILGTNDKLFFILNEPNGHIERPLLLKTLTSANLDLNNNILINFSSDDTGYLLPGLYYYTIRLVRNFELPNEQIDTIRQKTKFIILD